VRSPSVDPASRPCPGGESSDQGAPLHSIPANPQGPYTKGVRCHGAGLSPSLPRVKLSTRAATRARVPGPATYVLVGAQESYGFIPRSVGYFLRRDRPGQRAQLGSPSLLARSPRTGQSRGTYRGTHETRISGSSSAYGNRTPANRRFPWGDGGTEGGTVRTHAALFA
jgi:hypothetical protein